MQFYQLTSELESGAIQGSKIIGRLFCPADQLERTILFQQNFCGAKLTVVIIAHGMAVGAGVVEHQDITDVDLGQAPLYSELVVIFTQTAGNVVNVIQNRRNIWKTL